MEILLLGLVFGIILFFIYLASTRDPPDTALLIGAAVVLIIVSIYVGVEGITTNGPPLLNFTDEYSQYWNCSRLDNICTGVPDNDSCEPYDQTQCQAVPNCTWNPDVALCYGTPDLNSCDPYNQTQCEGIDDCEWEVTDAECNGQPELDSCEPYNQTQCTGIGNCTWNKEVAATCTGTPSASACLMYNETQCLDLSNCTWDPDLSTCSGTPDNCTMLADYDPTGFKCEETWGCLWTNATEANCTGTVDNCTQLTSWGEAKCNETDGCDWFDAHSECDGTVANCTQLISWGEAKCLETSGCNWFDSDANCTGTPSVSCLWLGAYDPVFHPGQKCQETSGCSWGAQVIDSTCDRVIVFHNYSNYSDVETSSRTDSLPLILSIVGLLLGVYFMIGGISGSLDRRHEGREDSPPIFEE